MIWEYLSALFILLFYPENQEQLWTVTEGYIYIFFFSLLYFQHVANDEWSSLNVLA